MISAMVRDGRMDKAEDWAKSYSLGHYVKRAFRWSTVRKLADRDMRRAFAKVAGSKIRQVSSTAASSVAPSRASANGIASSRFIDPMEKVLARGASVHFVYGREDEERFGEFEEARGARLGEILDAAGPAVEVTMVDGTIVDIQDIIAQDQIIELVADWASRVPISTVGAAS
jgi:hypothetical protein